LHISPDFEGAIGDTIFVQAGYGMFFWDRIEARATFSYTLLEDVAGADSDYKASELDLVGEYHIDLGGALVPMWVPGSAGASLSSTPWMNPPSSTGRERASSTSSLTMWR